MSEVAPAESGSQPVFRSAKRGGVVTIGGQLAKAVVQFFGLVIFSRLLTPEDFGLVAMLTVFIMLGELLRDFGLTQAAMQAKELRQAQASNLFWVSLVIGSMMTTLLILATPYLADLFDEPELTSIAPWIACSFILNAAQAQHQVQLARAFRFGVLTATDVLAQVLGLLAGVLLALDGRGYWALVAQFLVALTALLVLRASISRWVPGRPRLEPGMGALYRYGRDVGLAQLVAYGAYNADSYVIALRYGAGSLGIYTRAFQLLMVPFNQLLAPLTNVALPVMARRKHETGDFYSLLLKAQTVMGAAFVLAFALVAALGEPIVALVLGPEWSESAIVLRILAVGGAAQFFSYMAYWAFLISGNTKQLFLQNVATKALLAALVIVGAQFGIEGVAVGYATGLIVSWPISLLWLRACDRLPITTFASAAAQLLLPAAISALLAHTAFTQFDEGRSASLALGLAVSAAIPAYIAMLFCLPAPRVELILLLRSVTNGHRN